MSFPAGHRLGPYEVLGPIGSGGMGDVYRARDTRLLRDIAIKVPRLGGDGSTRARFEREARAAAALTHPNVLSVHDVGTSDGTLYVVSELLVGETLRDALSRGPLPWRRAAEVAAAVADGLAAAHDAGLVHRDVKPENVFLTSDGRVKVLDFGLARHEPDRAPGGHAATATEENVVVGTAAYMAPETLNGAPADARSDLFSLGCVVHEMLTGARAFAGRSTPEVWSAILTSSPRDVREAAPGVPEAFARLVRRCLERAPEARFQSARDLVFALRGLEPGARGGRTWIAVAASVAAAAVIAALALQARRPASREASVAVLPFACGEAGSEYLGDGLAENLINRLTRLPRVRVAARASAFAFRSERDVRTVAQKLGVSAVVTGRVARERDLLVVQVDLVQAEKGTQLWGERYSRPFAQVVAVEDEIAQEIAQALGARLTGDVKEALGSRGTASPAAYDLTLRGRFHASRRDEDGLKQALELYGQALREDPRYARAWCGLADAYNLVAFYGAAPPGDVVPKAKEAALKALDIDARAPEAHVSLADILYQFDWDWPAAEREFRRAIELGPNGAAAHHWYSNFLSVSSRFPESMSEIEKARGLDPLNPVIQNDLALAHYWAGRLDATVARLSELASAEPSFPLARFYGALALGHLRRFDEAFASVRKLEEITGGPSPDSIGLRGWIAARAGRRDQAKSCLASLQELARGRFVSAFPVAFVHVGLGETDEALSGLEKAVEEKAGRLVYLKVERAFDPLRALPRFEALVRRVRIPG